MSTIMSLIKRYPVLTYYALTFVISWGGTLMAIGLGGILGTQEVPEAQLPFVYLAVLLGPSVAGLLLTSLCDGRAGFRELFSRLLRWRAGARWYAVALLTAPLLITAILYALSLASPAFLPAIVTADDKVSLLLTGMVMGLGVGFFEEIGWTGFVLPRLRQRYSPLTTGLIMGLLWGLWHFPLFSGSTNSSGAVPPALYLAVLLFSFLPPFRALMVQVYDRTGSLLVAVLMHVPLAASQMILNPVISGAQLVTYDLVFAAALWICVAAVQGLQILPRQARGVLS